MAPNHSATKFEWMMGEGNAVSGGDLCLGTVDSWLAWVLTGATAHVTDLTNAAATGLLATDGSWDTALLDHLSIPVGSLPELVGSAGVVRRQAVDVSPFRRINQALYLITTGARESSFRNIKTISECLADEIINAARASPNSYAIKKKDEIERVAKANR